MATQPIRSATEPDVDWSPDVEIDFKAEWHRVVHKEREPSYTTEREKTPR
jgi:hypothetical protein